MNCPSCGYKKSKVLLTERRGGKINKRRRMCWNCRERWNTVELFERGKTAELKLMKEQVDKLIAATTNLARTAIRIGGTHT